MKVSSVKSLLPFLEGEDERFPSVILYAGVEALTFYTDDLLTFLDRESVLSITVVSLSDLYFGAVSFNFADERSVVVVCESNLEHVHVVWDHQFILASLLILCS